ncbi:MAG: TRAP transporter TatT component family protein [Deltaproteobacteria bacterium]|nr:TRAP transporter TatT component family protein [Deltaproteobacteria bacterium]
MFKKAVLLIAVALLAAVAGSALAATPEEMIAQADQLYAERADVAKAEQAAQLYEQALAADPRSEDAAWKLARTEYYLGNKAPKDQKEAIFQKGVDAAKKAVAINPKSVPGHFWLGVCYGVYGNAKGIMSSLSLVDPIKEEMETVLKLDPNYEGGGPQRVLGRLYFKLPGLMGGDNDKAVAYLQEAIKLGPTRWLNQLYLAEVYADLGKKDEAKALLEQVIAGPAPQGLEPEYQDWKALAEKQLKEL